VKLNGHSSQLHQRVLNKMLEALIEQAKEVSPDFREVYREIFYGGSYFDKLKVKSTPYEYDLNFVFHEPKSSFDICNLGDDFRKPNFATLRTNCHNLTPVWRKLIGKDRQNNNIISPKKMFDLLHRTIDQALTKLGKKFKLDGQEYRLTRKDGGAPIVLKVQGGQNVFFTVDVVPSFKFEFHKLKVACNDLHRRLTNEIIQNHNIKDVQVGCVYFVDFSKASFLVCENECPEELG